MSFASAPGPFSTAARRCGFADRNRYYRAEAGDAEGAVRLGGSGDHERGDRVVSHHIACVTIVVRDYDEAIYWYCEILGFRLVEDTRLTDTKRWVRIAPAGSRDFSLLLARAVAPEQVSRIGNQTGGRVFLFLNTDDFWRDYHALSERGVIFRRPPQDEPYGAVAVFEDLYGNLWDLIEPHEKSHGTDEKGSWCGLSDVSSTRLASDARHLIQWLRFDLCHIACREPT